MSKHSGENTSSVGGEQQNGKNTSNSNSSSSSSSAKWPPRKYGVREYLLFDAPAGCFLYYLCEVVNRPRMCPKGKVFVGPSLLPFLI